MIFCFVYISGIVNCYCLSFLNNILFLIYIIYTFFFKFSTIEITQLTGKDNEQLVGNVGQGPQSMVWFFFWWHWWQLGIILSVIFVCVCYLQFPNCLINILQYGMVTLAKAMGHLLSLSSEIPGFFYYTLQSDKIYCFIGLNYTICTKTIRQSSRYFIWIFISIFFSCLIRCWTFYKTRMICKQLLHANFVFASIYERFDGYRKYPFTCCFNGSSFQHLHS